MEERIIDDEYARGIRLKKTKDGYIDATDELAEKERRAGRSSKRTNSTPRPKRKTKPRAKRRRRLSSTDWTKASKRRRGKR